ncbi:23S rRNA (adenine(2030)-N(6))-methyltransferase RlmJ [Halotalea alkalilenta]|uniref:23S rRNA (adenine(2030)-N(6))-methyltransferase RlmJ n=1 Tax=Halotalea alkalilenta TaxID=376489 RepID=UPI00047F297D|nr:23S rRNA (adenine(2030)-N(6))-methyltransferase RlmJ [Halotalea alkalilenta]
MLAYQHAYHAGNIADVHKHLTLFALSRQMTAKTSSITFVDTHAGRGLYPLDAAETQRGGEYRDGVLPLWQARDRLQDDELLDDWLAALDLLNPRMKLECYPGSPWWFAQMMREGDRLELYELHPREYAHLDDLSVAAGGLPVAARRHFADGLEAVVKHLPVPTPRLCVLIDPSYEIKRDYLTVAETLGKIGAKARHAVVAIWYPLLPEERHLELLEASRATGLRKLLRSELRYRDPGKGRGMYGSGMLLFNPPWRLDDELRQSFDHLAAFYGGGASHHLDWWVEE